MTKKRRWLPFSWTPASWGLSGRSRQIAEAEYNYTGKQLELVLADINAKDPLHAQELGLDVKIRHGDITKYDYDAGLLEIQAQREKWDDTELQVRKAELDHEHGKISDAQMARTIADLRKEPYVNVMRMGIDEENVVQGFFELDWNDHFVKMLQEAGITGKSDEEVVNRWFNGVCRTVLLQEQADQDWGMRTDTPDNPDVEYRSSSKD